MSYSSLDRSRPHSRSCFCRPFTYCRSRSRATVRRRSPSAAFPRPHPSASTHRHLRAVRRPLAALLHRSLRRRPPHSRADRRRSAARRAAACCTTTRTLCTATVCRPRARAATSSPAPGQTLNPAPPCHSLITIPPPLLLRASPAPHCVACGPYIALAPPRHRLVPPAQNRHRTAFCYLSRWVVTRGKERRSWLRSPRASGLAQRERPRGPRWWLRPPRSRRQAVLVRSRSEIRQPGAEAEAEAEVWAESEVPGPPEP
jgi:hypothetical protein